MDIIEAKDFEWASGWIKKIKIIVEQIDQKGCVWLEDFFYIQHCYFMSLLCIMHWSAEPVLITQLIEE